MHHIQNTSSEISRIPKTKILNNCVKRRATDAFVLTEYEKSTESVCQLTTDSTVTKTLCRRNFLFQTNMIFQRKYYGAYQPQ
jgi:hypothetical protein